MGYYQTWNWVTFCDPATWESSDPETQLTRWPCSIMNSKCRLMLQTNVCNGQEVCQFLSLFGVCTLLKSKILKIIYWMPIFQWRLDGFSQKYISLYLYLGLFRKSEKLGSHTGSIWWPGDPDVKDDPNDPLTRWPNDPVPCLAIVIHCAGIVSRGQRRKRKKATKNNKKFSDADMPNASSEQTGYRRALWIPQWGN